VFVTEPAKRLTQEWLLDLWLVGFSEGSSLLGEKMLLTSTSGTAWDEGEELAGCQRISRFCLHVCLNCICSWARDHPWVHILPGSPQAAASFAQLHPELNPSPQRLLRCSLLYRRRLLHYAWRINTGWAEFIIYSLQKINFDFLFPNFSIYL